jgi:peptidyl-prolyl cis-trans isomerase C
LRIGDRRKVRTALGSDIVPLLVCALLCLAGLAHAAAGQPAATAPQGGMDSIVAARVNGVEITMGSVAVMMGSLGANRVHGPGPPAGVEEARSEALDQLILQELAYQKAKSEGMTVEPKEIDAAVTDMRRKLGGEEKLREFAEKERITEEGLRARIERNILLKRIFTREIQDKASVSEEEIRREYESDKERYDRPEKIVVTDVVFFLEPGDAESLRKAGEIRRKIDGDPEKNPRKVASDGTFAVLDVEIKGEQGRELYDAAKQLSVGELSGVFAAGGNLHVIKLQEYTPRRHFTFEEVKGRIKGQLKARAVRKRSEEWEAELRQGARIEIVEIGGRGKPSEK